MFDNGNDACRGVEDSDFDYSGLASSGDVKEELNKIDRALRAFCFSSSSAFEQARLKDYFLAFFGLGTLLNFPVALQ